MDNILIFLLIVLFLSILVCWGYLLYLKKTKQKNNHNQEKNKQPVEAIQNFEEPKEQQIILPYKKKFLLTKNEWAFYKCLKPVADELGYTVLAKIRVADLVEVTAKDRSEWQTYFNKISKKHIDFILAKPENLQIVLLIELDDNSHNEAQKERDDFIDELYKQTGYKFIRVRGTGNLKEIINQQLNEKQDTKESTKIINQQQKSPAPSCLPQSGNMDGTPV